VVAALVALGAPAGAQAQTQSGADREARVSIDARGTARVTFTRASSRWRRIAGRTWRLSCEATAGELTTVGVTSTSSSPWPRRRRSARVPIGRDRELRYDFCLLEVGGRTGWRELAAVALNAAGRRQLADRDAATALLDAVGFVTSAADLSGRWPTPALLRSQGLEPLSSRDGRPGAGRTGVFLDEAAREVHAVRVTADGRALFVAVRGGTLTTNVPRWVLQPRRPSAL
jgi:hypothetical protein